MSRMAVVAAVAAAAVATISVGRASAEDDDCTIQRTGGSSESIDNALRIVVASGAICGTRHSTTFYSAGEQRTVPTSRVVLTARPRNGNVTITGGRFSYKSNNGFMGTDPFALTAHPKPVGNQPPRQFRYQVQVTVCQVKASSIG